MSLTFLRPRRRIVARHVENVSMHFAAPDPDLIKSIAICCDAVGDNEARAFDAALSERWADAARRRTSAAFWADRAADYREGAQALEVAKEWRRRADQNKDVAERCERLVIA